MDLTGKSDKSWGFWMVRYCVQEFALKREALGPISISHFTAICFFGVSKFHGLD